MILLSKLSVANINLDKKTIVGLLKDKENPEKNLPNAVKLAQFAGRADKWVSKVTTLGESLEFHGSFKAKNIHTGEVFAANRCFMPKIMESQVSDAMTVRADDGQDTGQQRSIEFAFWVLARGDQDGQRPTAVGYTYSFEPVLGRETVDPVDALMLAFEPKKAGNEEQTQSAPAASGTGGSETPATDQAPAPTGKKGK